MKPFTILFFTLSIIGIAHGQNPEPRSIDGVVNQGSLTIPFLVVNNNEDNPSYLATSLAVGAAAAFGTVLYIMNTHEHSHGESEATGMNGGFGSGSEILDGAQAGAQGGAGAPGRYRYKRFVENFDGDFDGFFSMIRNMDSMECGKNLVCQLEAKAKEDLEQDETMILSLFSDLKFKKPVNLSSAKAQYDLAAKLGSASRNQNICRQLYVSCPYTSEEMMTAFRNSHNEVM